MFSSLSLCAPTCINNVREAFIFLIFVLSYPSTQSLFYLHSLSSKWSSSFNCLPSNWSTQCRSCQDGQRLISGIDNVFGSMASFTTLCSEDVKGCIPLNLPKGKLAGKEKTIITQKHFNPTVKSTIKILGHYYM